MASAAVYGAVRGATVEQIESAIGLVVAHYVPFRAIRHGEQLSDSKGASAAISAEAAVLSMRRAMCGFIGPADIFRNPQAAFCLCEPQPTGNSPFDLELTAGGDDFAVIGLLVRYPELAADAAAIRRLRITIYEPAFSIIGDPHKRDPRTRQSADHSMVYIIATLLRKAIEQRRTGWEELMLEPQDYADTALFHPLTRDLISRIDFRHGGPEYDRRYPDGIPTSLEIDHASLGTLASGLIMYPEGHARNTSGNLDHLLRYKFDRLAALGVKNTESLYSRVTGLEHKSAAEIRELYSFPIDAIG
jgi:2-methylcitrate dehydratase